jgi:single-strand DNA-binding protein
MVLQLELIGYIGQDARLSDVNGKKVLNFSVAHSERFKNKDGVETEKTTFVECSLWDKEKVAPYLTKGSLVRVVGSPVASFYKNKNGEIVPYLNLSVFDLKLILVKKAENV